MDWGSYIASVADTDAREIGALIHSMKDFFSEVALYLYKSTIKPSMTVWAGAPSWYLDMVGKLQKRVYRTVGPSPAFSFLNFRLIVEM